MEDSPLNATVEQQSGSSDRVRELRDVRNSDTPGAGRVAILPGLSRDYLLHHRVCPDEVTEDGVLRVATAPGAYTEALDELSELYGRPVCAYDAGDDAVARMIERFASAGTAASENSETSSLDAADAREIANQPPVVRYVNLLLRDAFDAGASDIHLESTRSGMTARLRVDGMLVNAPEPPRTMHAAVVSRVKLLADLDIAERRRPQDGRIRARLESTELDLRVSTVPTVHGESVVLRLLDRGDRPVALDTLGMPGPIHDWMSALARRAHGMILVTGPTGSGKTTTLYGALRQRDAMIEKLVTVEDPVEYQLPGVTQVPVHRQAGVTFGSALRAILRQDPDVVMIGEMRDPETAEVAIQAAMTGHLVYSTLHTNDAPGALPRLYDLGVAPYLVASTVSAILAQRLVRKVCPACRVSASPDPALLDSVLALAGATESIAIDDYGVGSGCAECRGTGYSGRVGIFELVLVDDGLRELIADRRPVDAIRHRATQSGYEPMALDGVFKAAAGMTTLDEILRVADA